MAVKKLCTEQQLIEFKTEARAGKNITQLAKIFGVCRETIISWLTRYQVSCPAYEDYLAHKNFWTKDKIDEFVSLYEAHELTNEEIALHFGINIGMVTKKIKNMGLTSKYRKFIPTNEQLLKIRDMAAKGETRSAMATYLMVDRPVVKRLLEEYDIPLKKSTRNSIGKQYDWTDEKIAKLRKLYQSDQYNLIDIANEFECSTSIILHKASELGLSKGKSVFITDKAKEYYYKNFGIKSIEEMMIDRRASEYQVLLALYILNLSNDKPVHPKRNMPKTSAFYDDYINPLLSGEEVGRRHGISGSSVCKWRRKDFGDNFRRMLHPYFKTSIEYQTEDLLLQLDRAYLPQYQIGPYKIDYYLGLHRILEVNGDFWHSTEKNKVKDGKKKAYLLSKGYSILEVWESDIKTNPDKIKREILDFLQND